MHHQRPERAELEDPGVRVAFEAVMANIKSQIKRNRKNEQARVRNQAVRSELRTRVKNAVSAAENSAEDAQDKLRLAFKRIDKAAAKGIIHRNQAARRKSRLMKKASAS